MRLSKNKQKSRETNGEKELELPELSPPKKNQHRNTAPHIDLVKSTNNNVH